MDGDFPLFDALEALVVFVGVVVVGIWLLRYRSDFTISVRRGVYRIKGQMPTPLRQAVEEYLTRELEKHPTFKVHGTWQKKRLRIWFSGAISRGEQQRLRNIMINP